MARGLVEGFKLKDVPTERGAEVLIHSITEYNLGITRWHSEVRSDLGRSQFLFLSLDPSTLPNSHQVPPALEFVQSPAHWPNTMFGRSSAEDASVEALNPYDTSQHAEREALLPTSRETESSSLPLEKKWPRLADVCSKSQFSILHISAAFLTGVIACVLFEAVIYPSCFTGRQNASTHRIQQSNNDVIATALAPPYVGSTEVHHFPPTKPTNAYPSQFPTNVGYAGGTPTGAEPAVIATAPSYPIQNGQCGNKLIAPESFQPALSGAKKPEAGVKGKKSKGFNLLRSWGNLSPWYSVDKGTFGLDSGPEIPETCRITGLHFLHRHGARYPTAWGEFCEI